MLEAYYKAQGRFDLKILAVATEDSIPPRKLKPIAAQLTLSMARHMHSDYGMLRHEVPTNYIIDRNGILRYAQPGAFSLDDLNELLVPLLKEPVPGASEPATQAEAPKQG